MSVIIDGMDQSKTGLPHIPSNPKSMAGQYTLPTHLTGVHAHGRLTMVLIDWGQYPHDSNLTINALLHMLLHYKVCGKMWGYSHTITEHNIFSCRTTYLQHFSSSLIILAVRTRTDTS